MAEPQTPSTSALVAVLSEARRLGFLGPGPVTTAVEHARRFESAVPAGTSRALDLGSGGGLPGLVLAHDRPELRVVLLDASERRTSWLSRAVARLGLIDRVDVVTARAEDLGHRSEWRGTQDAVVARSFGPPAWTAECAAALLGVGGRLVVSEPPETSDGDRWAGTATEDLGLERRPAPRGLAVFEQVRPAPTQVPRRRRR